MKKIFFLTLSILIFHSNAYASLSAGLGATEFTALSEHEKCFAPLKGYKAKLTADLIERKLTNEQLTPEQAKFLKEDLIAARQAQAAGTDQIVSPGGNPQRYLMDISQDDQVAINAQFGAFYNKVVSECQGRDHMNTGHTTKMNYVQDNSQEMAERARQEAATTDTFDCLKQVSGLRWRIMARLMQEKLNATGASMTPAERVAFQADIAAVEQAGITNTSAPVSPDPAVPGRYLTRLNAEDQVALNTAYSTESQQHIANCDSKIDTKIHERDWSKSGGLVDHSKSPANTQAQMNPAAPSSKPYQNLPEGSTNLQFLKKANVCYEPLRGHFAKVHAAKLQEKFYATSNIDPQKKIEWQQDISAWRSAQAIGADKPVPPDPNNPDRWQSYLTKDEIQAINKEHADFNNKIIRECADGYKMSAG